MVHKCTVCGYNNLKRPPEDDMICPSCGTHFGNDDIGNSLSELRSRWINAGAKWYSKRTPCPMGWRADAQLRNIILAPSQPELEVVDIWQVVSMYSKSATTAVSTYTTVLSRGHVTRRSFRRDLDRNATTLGIANEWQVRQLHA